MGAMRAPLVVELAPLLDEHLGLGAAAELFAIQSLVLRCSRRPAQVVKRCDGPVKLLLQFCRLPAGCVCTDGTAMSPRKRLR
jgi:hypothetical protein